MLGESGVLSVRITTKFYDTVASIMHDAEPEPGVAPLAGLETPAEARAASTLRCWHDRARRRHVR